MSCMCFSSQNQADTDKQETRNIQDAFTTTEMETGKKDFIQNLYRFHFKQRNSSNNEENGSWNYLPFSSWTKFLEDMLEYVKAIL